MLGRIFKDGNTGERASGTIIPKTIKNLLQICDTIVTFNMLVFTHKKKTS